MERLANVAALHFNLGCYVCRPGDFARAKGRLKRAIELREDSRLRALEDEDLRPVWDAL